MVGSVCALNGKMVGSACVLNGKMVGSACALNGKMLYLWEFVRSALAAKTIAKILDKKKMHNLCLNLIEYCLVSQKKHALSLKDKHSSYFSAL